MNVVLVDASVVVTALLTENLKVENHFPYIESFFGRYKCEEVYRNEYRTFTEALLGWVQYKDWYKTERIHQGLGWVTIPAFKQWGRRVSNEQRLSFSNGILV